MANSLQLPFECEIMDKNTFYTKGLFDINDNQIIPLANIMGMVICIQGEAKVQIDNNSYIVNRGDMYWLFPSLFAKILYASDDLRFYCLRVDFEFVAPIMGKIDTSTQLYFRANPCFKLQDEQFNVLCKMLSFLTIRIKREESSDLKGLQRLILRELIVSSGTTIVYEAINYHLCNEHVMPIANDNSEQMVQNFIMNVYNEFRLHRDVNYYAEQLCITPGYLTSLVKHKTGKPASQWIIDNVITESKLLLRETNKSIKEIAFGLNFSNQSFFGKYFKLYVGLSPKDFRNKVRSRK